MTGNTIVKMTETARVLWGSIAIVLVGALLGITVNALSPTGITLLPASSSEVGEPPPLPAGMHGVTLSEALLALEDPDALFLDARSAEEYRAGHIMGSLNLPAYDFDEAFPEVMDRVEEAGYIIIYCDGEECSDGIMVAERLLEFGFQDISILLPGWRGWRDAGGEMEEGATR